MRCNEAGVSTLLHNEINLDEAKGGQQVLPQKALRVLNDDFGDLFFKDFEVTSKHFQESHLFGLVSGL